MTTLIPKVKQPATGAVNQPINIKLNEAISVKDFGAVGDGVTDDSAAIQAAIDYAVTNRTPNPALFQTGGVVWFPQGRYLIKATLQLYVGITIIGEPSGLGSVPIAQAGSGAQIVLSTTLAGGGAWNNSAIFNVPGGGPITIQDIGLNGTSTVTTSYGLVSGDGVTDIGATQAHFTNVRWVGFSIAIKATKLFDVTFYDCGFEYNTVALAFSGGTFSSITDIKFNSCVFWGGTSSVISVGASASVTNLIFTACTFDNDVTQALNCNVINVADATLINTIFNGCKFSGLAGDSAIVTSTTTSAVRDTLFSGCVFSSTHVATFNYSAPVGQSYDFIVSGCTLNESNFTSAYELTNLNFTGNIIRGTSTINLSSGNETLINSNDFAECSVNPPIVLTDVFSNLSISNNVFATNVALIPVNITSTYVKMIGNTSFADFSSNAIVTNANATYTVLANDETIIQTTAASVYTLPTVTSWKGRKITIVSNFAGAVTSATSNVVGITGGAAGTAILAATSGKWATLQSNGVSWIIIASN